MHLRLLLPTEVSVDEDVEKVIAEAGNGFFLPAAAAYRFRCRAGAGNTLLHDSRRPRGVRGRQLIVLRAMTAGLFDELPLDAIGRGEAVVREAVREQNPELYQNLARGEMPDDAEWQKLLDTARQAIARTLASDAE